MNNYQAYILLFLFCFATSILSIGQDQRIYTLPLEQEEIASKEFTIQTAENCIQEAKKLASQDADSALYLATKAVRIAQKLKDKELEGSAFRRIGLILYTHDELASSVHFLHRAEQALENETGSPEQLFAYNNLGAVYEYLGKKQEALNYYFKSLEQAEILQDVPRQISALSNLGDLSVRAKQYKSAEDFLSRGLELLDEHEDEQKEARLNLQLGLAYTNLEDFDKAETYVHKALNYYQAQEEVQASFLGHCYNALGIISKSRKDHPKAKEYYLKALDINKSSESGDMITAFLNLGNNALEQKKLSEALGYFNQALQHPQIEDKPLQLKDLYWNLSITHGELKQLDKAYEFQNAYAILSDSIFEAEIRETASRGELLYNKARSERKEAASKLELERQKTLSNYYLMAGSIAGLLALISFLFMRNYRQRKEALKKELVLKEESNKMMLVEMLRDHEVETLNAMLDGQESERKRIARDLHDSLGGTLAAVQMTLASLERKLPEISEVAKKTYDKAEYLLDQAYQQMRGISHNLADLSLKDGGLSPALAQLKETLSENTNLNIRMDYASLGGRRLDSNVEQHSYRITQELFQNIIKHAEASFIEYELNYSPIKLHISIKDDGKGFDYEPGSKVSGIGLNNILTRVRQLDGEMEIQSKPGEGTLIEVDIPLVLS